MRFENYYTTQHVGQANQVIILCIRMPGGERSCRTCSAVGIIFFSYVFHFLVYIPIPSRRSAHNNIFKFDGWRLNKRNIYTIFQTICGRLLSSYWWKEEINAREETYIYRIYMTNFGESEKRQSIGADTAGWVFTRHPDRTARGRVLKLSIYNLYRSP